MRLRLCVFILGAVLAIGGCAGGGSNGTVPPPTGQQGPPPTTLPARYTISDLGADVTPLHVNDSGAVVGYTGSFTAPTPFLWRSGSLVALSPISGYSSGTANWINNAGEIVGVSGSQTSSMVWRATKFAAGTPGLDLGAPSGFSSSDAFAVNDTGMIVGGASSDAGCCVRDSVITAFDGNGNAHVLLNQTGFALSVNDTGEFSGDVTNSFPKLQFAAFKAMPFTLLPPGGDGTEAPAINNKGDVVVYSDPDPAASGEYVSWVVYANGTQKQIDPPDNAGVLEAFAINDQDWVVGSYQLSGALTSSAFVDVDSVVDLNTLTPLSSGWTLERATSVNTWGQIAGYGLLNGTEHGFLLTPSR